MNKADDFLIVIHTEELPPKSLLTLASAFHDGLIEQLKKINLPFGETHLFASPRHIGVQVEKLASMQPDQMVTRKGPALAAAFDASGKPSKACVGFARGVGVEPDALTTIKTEQGEWVAYEQKVTGKKITELAQDLVTEALRDLPIKKRMRWGDSNIEFVRPVHSVVLLFGDEIIPATILGCETSRVTNGHHFLSKEAFEIPHAAMFASLMETEGHIIVDFEKRKTEIKKTIQAKISKSLNAKHQIIANPDLENEVTGLVEWPSALLGKFDEEFLQLPQEVLTSAMQDHQRYFPITDGTNLQAHFVVVSNNDTFEPQNIITGNERVLRARLKDAAFFYESDRKEKLSDRLQRLKGMVFQAKLGTLYDKSLRVAALAELIAADDKALAKRAGELAKTDLTTLMVGEFPELQGTMGYYYALADKENPEVALAIKEHYYPRFADDQLPRSKLGIAVALADRIDSLVGSFAINQIPTGDKDPYGLRRAAIGLLRILIENEIDLDLQNVMQFAAKQYDIKFENQNLIADLLNFLQERLRSFYQEKNISADVFASVAALNIYNPYDIDRRIKAVQTFKKLKEAETLSIANKRVSNILAKYDEAIDASAIDPQFFENASEQKLAQALRDKEQAIGQLYERRHYDKVLLNLAELREPVDDFFDHVMVMTDDKKRRENRILLLKDLRNLFLKIADIALLQ